MKQSNKRHAKNEQIQSHHCSGVIAYFVPKSGMPIYVLETQKSGNYLSWSQHTWTFWKVRLVRASKSWIFRMFVNCSVLADTHSRPNLRNPRAAGSWCKATHDESLNPSCWANEVSYETDSNSINRTPHNTDNIATLKAHRLKRNMHTEITITRFICTPFCNQIVHGPVGTIATSSYVRRLRGACHCSCRFLSSLPMLPPSKCLAPQGHQNSLLRALLPPTHLDTHTHTYRYMIIIDI